MPPSSELCLLALLWWIRTLRNSFESFLRWLLFGPHALRSLRHILLLFSRKTGTSPKNVPKKTGGQSRPSFPRTPGVCKGYSTIYASQDFNRAGEQHLPSGLDNTEFLHLGPIARQSESVPPSPASSLGPSLPGSPQRSDIHLPGGSTPFTEFPPIGRLSRPITLTHSHITSTQFAGTPRRTRSQSPSPFPRSHILPQLSTLDSPVTSPVQSQPPSPMIFPEPYRFPPSNVLDNSDGTQIPDVMISISPPAWPSSIESDSIPPSLLSFQGGNLSQFPTPGAEHFTLDHLDQGSLGSASGNACHSSESLRANNLAQSLNRAQYPPSFPRPYTLQVTVIDIPIVNATGWSDGKRRSIGVMHSEQVSCYMNKGAV